VKPITKWQANDGFLFATEAECLAHETLCAKVNDVLSRLRSVPNTSEFWRGGGFVQQDKLTFLSVQRELAAMAHERHRGCGFDDHFEFVATTDLPAGGNLIGRLLDDAGPAPISNGWRRLVRTDRQFREWGQPYFAANPAHGTQQEIGASS
jgi:hypothetical protein